MKGCMLFVFPDYAICQITSEHWQVRKRASRLIPNNNDNNNNNDDNHTNSNNNNDNDNNDNNMI